MLSQEQDTSEAIGTAAEVQTRDFCLHLRHESASERLICTLEAPDTFPAPCTYPATPIADALSQIRMAQALLNHTRTPERMRVVGSGLFELFPAEVRDAIRAGLEWAQAAKRLLRLYLHLGSGLQELAWELLYDTVGRFDFLALHCAVIRYSGETRQGLGPWPLIGPLHIVRINLAGGQQARVGSNTLVDLVPSDPGRSIGGLQDWTVTEPTPTMDDLVSCLQDEPCHVLEYNGRGGHHANPGAYIVLLEGQEEKELDAAHLARILDAAKGNRVVVFYPQEGQPQTSLFAAAEQLALDGRRACIAFRSSTDKQESELFRGAVYPRLSSGESAELAVLHSRRELQAKGLSWDQAALFANPGFEAPFQRVSQELVDRAIYLQARLGSEITRLSVERRKQAVFTLYWLLAGFERAAIEGLRTSFVPGATYDLAQKMAEAWFMNKSTDFTSAAQDTTLIEGSKLTMDISKLVIGPHDRVKAAIKAIHYWSDVDFPAQVVVDKWERLGVSVQPEQLVSPSGDIIHRSKRHDWDREMRLNVQPRAETILDLVVTAPGFKIHPQATGRLVLHRDTDPAPVEFWLMANETGAHEITVDYIQNRYHLNKPGEAPGNATYVGRVELKIEVVDALPAPAQRAEPLERLGFDIKAWAGVVDATLVVHYSTLPSDAELSFYFFFPNGVVTAPCSTPLKMPPQQWVQDTVQMIRQKGQAGQLGDSIVEAVGRKLFDLLPPPVQGAYWKYLHTDELSSQPKSLSIVTDDPWLPWELIKPYDKSREDGFLCQQFAVGRWMFDARPWQPVIIDEARAVALPLLSAPTLDKLEPGERDIYRTDRAPGSTHIERELSSVLELRELGVNVQIVPGRKASLLDTLQTGGFQLLHIAGHGSFQHEPEQSAIQLEDGELMAMEVGGRYASFGQQSPLVILNACHTGRQGYTLTGVGGWATAFAQAGCGAFVGTLWAVRDDCAARFAEYLYREIASGQVTLGEAVRRARLRLEENERQGQSPQYTWLAYVLFGNPLTRFELPGGEHAPSDRH